VIDSEDTIWETVRPWEEEWESLTVNEIEEVEQELGDKDRQGLFWRHRPNGFTVTSQ
jgi:glycine/D-amino acid oxidase-like deaminating enzyme